MNTESENNRSGPLERCGRLAYGVPPYCYDHSGQYFSDILQTSTVCVDKEHNKLAERLYD